MKPVWIVDDDQAIRWVLEKALSRAGMATRSFVSANDVSAALRVETTSTVLTRDASVGDILNIPVNHFEGNYTCSPETLAELRSDDRIVLRYVDNPNGSVDDIAGICNAPRNVVGLMPHPERATSALLGSTDGLVLLGSLLAAATV